LTNSYECFFNVDEVDGCPFDLNIFPMHLPSIGVPWSAAGLFLHINGITVA